MIWGPPRCIPGRAPLGVARKRRAAIYHRPAGAAMVGCSYSDTSGAGELEPRGSSPRPEGKLPANRESNLARPRAHRCEATLLPPATPRPGVFFVALPARRGRMDSFVIHPESKLH